MYHKVLSWVPSVLFVLLGLIAALARCSLLLHSVGFYTARYFVIPFWCIAIKREEADDITVLNFLIKTQIQNQNLTTMHEYQKYVCGHS